MQFRFNLEGSGFDLTVMGADREGKDVEVIITGQMAIGMASGIMMAMDQNAQRSAAIAGGRKSEPEIRTIPETHFAT
jgi:hypothetical protein